MCLCLHVPLAAVFVYLFVSICSSQIDSDTSTAEGIHFGASITAGYCGGTSKYILQFALFGGSVSLSACVRTVRTDFAPVILFLRGPILLPPEGGHFWKGRTIRPGLISSKAV